MGLQFRQMGLIMGGTQQWGNGNGECAHAHPRTCTCTQTHTPGIFGSIEKFPSIAITIMHLVLCDVPHTSMRALSQVFELLARADPPPIVYYRGVLG